MLVPVTRGKKKRQFASVSNTRPRGQTALREQENLSPAVPSRAREQAHGVVSQFGAYRAPTYTTPQFAPVSSFGKA